LSNPELTAVTLSALMYPNPTTDKIILSLKKSDLMDLSYVLYDLNGKTLSSALVQQAETPISMQNLTSGVYILKVNQNNTELKTYKIIKK
jgi:Secretion system C-terminal sorting domain